MVAGHLREKRGYYHIVLSYIDVDGRRKTPTKSTGLTVKGNKKKAESMLLEARREKSLELERRRKGIPEVDTSNSKIAFTEFLTNWLEMMRASIEVSTFASYSYSIRTKINPYFDTDGEGMFPSGDMFSVYPYKNGAAPSLRHKVFHDGLEDMRLLYLVEEKLGRAAVIEALDRICGEPLTFKVYPRNNRFFEELYDFIFANL